MNLEAFPTSERAQHMMGRISPIYDNSYVGKWIFQVMGEEMDETWLRFEELRAQAHPETATWALPYWEERYGLTPKPSDSQEARRAAIITKRSMRAPMNPARLELIVSQIAGKDVECIENVAPYTFRIVIQDAQGDEVDTVAIIEAIRRAKPSHQTFELGSRAPERNIPLTITPGRQLQQSRRALPELHYQHQFTTTIFSAAGKGNYKLSRNTIPELKEDRL